MNIIKVTMNIDHISVSRKKTFELCQMSYRFKYHERRVVDKPEPFYFTYGKIVHKIAEEYVRGNGEQLISEVATNVLSGKVEIDKGRKAPTLPTEYKNKLPAHLKALKKITDQTGYDGKLEYHFEYDLDPPHKKLVVGFIDRIINKGDKFWILDYKTTKQGWWRTGPRDIVDDLQLRCYARVVQRDFGAKAENISCALYYLEGEELVGAKYTENSLLRAEQELLQTYIEIEQMKQEDAWGRVGKHCDRCDYKSVCPAYSLT